MGKPVTIAQKKISTEANMYFPLKERPVPVTNKGLLLTSSVQDHLRKGGLLGVQTQAYAP